MALCSEYARGNFGGLQEYEAVEVVQSVSFSAFSPLLPLSLSFFHHLVHAFCGIKELCAIVLILDI